MMSLEWFPNAVIVEGGDSGRIFLNIQQHRRVNPIPIVIPNHNKSFTCLIFNASARIKTYVCVIM